jgi:hypothetical protein
VVAPGRPTDLAHHRPGVVPAASVPGTVLDVPVVVAGAAELVDDKQNDKQPVPTLMQMITTRPMANDAGRFESEFMFTH